MTKRVKKNIKKTSKKNKNLFIFILIIIICFALVSYSEKIIKNKKEDYSTYNNFPFQYSESQKLWMTQLQIGIQPYDIPFHYHPKDLEDIVVEENIEDKIWAKPKQIFITMSPDVTPNEGIAAVEIAKLTGNRYKLFNIPTKSALTKPNNLTISITCMDAKEDVVVINFKKNKQNIVYSSGNCIHVEYVDSNESIRVASAFAYHILKIM